jgi:hypothetical protein
MATRPDPRSDGGRSSSTSAGTGPTLPSLIFLLTFDRTCENSFIMIYYSPFEFHLLFFPVCIKPPLDRFQEQKDGREK